MIRSFISLEIPPEIKKEIIKIQDSLPEFIGKKTEPPNLHLTLKFLGEIDNEKVLLVREKLRSVKVKKFEARIGKIGFFLSKGVIRIIWLYLSNCDILQKEIDRVLQDFFEPEIRFMSHLTIARVKDVKNKKDFIKNLNKIKIPQLEFEVKKFNLKKSTLTRRGAKYEDIESYPLI